MKRHFCDQCGAEIPEETHIRYTWTVVDNRGGESPPVEVCANCNQIVLDAIEQATKKPRQWNMPDLGFLGWFIESPLRIAFTFLAVVVALTLIDGAIGNLLSSY